MSIYLKRILFITSIAVLVPGASLAQINPCEDLAGFDFGDCEAILGWGVIDGDCQLIVGCSSPVPLFATQAECEAACIPQPTCDDLGDIDFGPCDNVLGYGLIDGDCTEISGCESPVPLFATVEECIAECVPVSTESLNWSSLKARYI